MIDLRTSYCNDEMRNIAIMFGIGFVTLGSIVWWLS
jgi:hypothetical protein